MENYYTREKITYDLEIWYEDGSNFHREDLLEVRTKRTRVYFWMGYGNYDYRSLNNVTRIKIERKVKTIKIDRNTHKEIE